MLKTGFRGERKGILTPSLSQGEGECGGGKSEGNLPLLTYSALADFLQRGNVATEKEECGDEKRGMWRWKGGGKKGEVYKIESLLFCPREKAHISCF